MGKLSDERILCIIYEYLFNQDFILERKLNNKRNFIRYQKNISSNDTAELQKLMIQYEFFKRLEGELFELMHYYQF